VAGCGEVSAAGLVTGRWPVGSVSGDLPHGLLRGSLGTDVQSEGLVVAGFGGGACFAEDFAVAMDLAVVVDAFAADFAGDAGGFVAGHLARVDGYGDPLFAEEVFVG